MRNKSAVNRNSGISGKGALGGELLLHHINTIVTKTGLVRAHSAMQALEPESQYKNGQIKEHGGISG